METILFLDACMRGELSRTRALCRRFLTAYTEVRPDCHVTRRDLTQAPLPVLTASLADRREALAAQGADDPMLQPARDVAGADLILIGAPYWDLSFPAALKVYLEWASVLGVTFRYTREGQQVGMSRARALVYLTTGGGPMAEQNYGFRYLEGWASMMGVGRACCVEAENLDIQGADVEGILSQAGDRAAALARRLAQDPL